MYGWMKKIAYGTTRGQMIGTAMFMTYSVSERKFSIPAVVHKAFEKFKTSGSTHKAGCMVLQDNNSTNNTHQNEDAQSSANESQETHSQPPNVELKIILLGATGSGKSSAGNVLLQRHGNDEGFKTSCFAKSETKTSILKSVTRTMEQKQISKTYKIDIIDTPAKRDTGLSELEFESEMKNAKQLSSPGPNALLFCIPANEVSQYFTEDVDYYKRYFDGTLFDSIIVVFTRCDQFKTENNLEFDSYRAMEQNHVLKKIKKHITLSNTLSKEEKTKKLEAVIDHIIDQKVTSSVLVKINSCICCAILAVGNFFNNNKQ